jgi:hypothetical protein
LSRNVVTTNKPCVTSQKSDGLIYTTPEATTHAYVEELKESYKALEKRIY